MAKRRSDGRISDERLGRYGAAVLLGFVLVGGALVLGSVFFGGGGSDDAAKPSLAETASPTALPSSAVSSSTPAAAATGLTDEAMTTFLDDYLDKVAVSPAEAWIMLTPEFQAASGGYAKYSAFWGKVELATPSEVFPDPTTSTVAYRVNYVYADGTTGDDRTRITLVDRDGTLLISGEG